MELMCPIVDNNNEVNVKSNLKDCAHIMDNIENKTIENKEVLQYEMKQFLIEVRKCFEIEGLLSSIKHSETNYINDIID